jgi:ankyrin repeat protein
MAEEEYNGICPIYEDIVGHFKELIDGDNAEATELFLNNLKKNFLKNYLFDRNSVCSLGYACENGKFNAALKMIEIGLREPEEVDLGEVDADGRTPLTLCCSSDDEMSVMVVKELLKGDCRPDAEYNNKKTALMRACDYKEDASLLIVNELLDFDYNLGFQVDSNDESGLMYLFDYRSNEDKKFLLHNKLYIKVAVKYLKLYYIHSPDDKTFKDVMKKICNDAEVRMAFSSPLLKVSIPGSKQGIDLNVYCREPEPTTEFAIGPPVASIESVPKPRRRLELDIPEAEEMPLVVGERVEGVSPGGRWVSREDAQRYIRLYPPGKGPNDGPGGGPAGGKKRKTIKRKNTSKKTKKTRRNKR